MEPGWLGRRVSVRRVRERTAQGRILFGDVVGDLVGLDAQTAVVEARDGLVEIPRDRIAAARLALPSTGDELALEAVAARGVRPADTASLGGWVLRADHGFLRRANSVLPLKAPGVPLGEALDQAGQWYAERGLPLLISVPREARRLLDAELGERGWPAETRAQLFVRRLDAVDPARPLPEVEIADAVSDEWLALYRGGEGASDAGRALLERHDRVGFALLRDASGGLAAIGRGVVDDGWLGISGVEVAPQTRRRGHASTVMDALWRWGAGHGARRSYLQVEADNVAALGLYERLGYWMHHDYHYRRPPA